MSEPAESADTIDAPAKGERATPTTGEERQLLAGRYEILGLLGVGGMGSVYRVRDTQLDEEVALKLLRPELLATPGALDRFRQEVKLARKVTHRNVARTFDIGDHEGGLLLTMELLDGESLAARIERDGAMPIEAAVSVGIELCRGLGAAHAAAVIHRDLKPDNILLTRDGRAVITDFGIARAYLGGNAARTAGILGTPAYMAPEQVEGAAEIDARADLYALGEILYEMLTGQRAWPSSSPIAAASARLLAPPPDPRALRPRVPDELAAIVLRLLARARDDRFARVEQVLARLSALNEQPGGAPRPSGGLAAAPRYVAASALGDKTVAVLPLANLGAPDYLADGILEDLVDTLSMTRGLRVRPSGVTLKYKGSALDARAIGRELGVQVVVESSVRAAGADYRLTARVISVDDGYQLWARRFHRPAAEILEVSDEAARAIAEALTTDLDAPGRGPVEGPLGAELYLRARAELRAAWHSSARIAAVAARFDEAAGQAPDDPHVLAGAAQAHARFCYFREASWAAHAERALYFAERAISLAPQLAEPWIAIATLRVDDGDGVGAARALHAALRAAPRSARAREMLGRLLLEADELDDAIGLLSSALDLDPSNVEPRWDLIRAHALRGDMASAEALAALPVDTDAGRVMRAYIRARIALWQPRERARAHPWVGPPGSGIVWSVVLLHEHVLRTRRLSPEDTAFLEEYAAGARSRIGPLARQTLAELNLVIDAPRPDRALGLVRDAVEGGLCDVAWMDRCPALAPLRGTPAWAELRARVDQRAARIRDAAREPEGVVLSARSHPAVKRAGPTEPAERPGSKETQEGSIVELSPAFGADGAPDRSGVRLGHFLLGEKRGQGAMGIVYAARDTRDGRAAAVKVLPGSLLADLGRARRFAAEAEVLASLDHPAIVRYAAHGVTQRGEPYLAMEWLEGEDLAQRLQRRALSVREAATLGRRVAEGLAAAHARGVVHRDIKPSNLFLRGGEAAEVTILDFGVARVEEAQLTLTATGALLGTPGYMAPEQARGSASVDARADLFSLGAVLFEGLAGQPAFTGQHVVAVLAKVLIEDPPPLASLRLDVPPALDALIARLLAKEPDARPASAAAVAAELAQMSLEGGGGGAALPRPRARGETALTDSEQRFLCVVIAGAPPGEAGGSRILASASTLPALSDRLSTLAAAAAPLGAEVVHLLDGSVLAITRRTGSAVDRAMRAARCALAFRPLLPGVPIAVATGPGDASAPVPVGQVLDRAAALVGAHEAGTWVDELTAGLLDARFVVRGGPEGRELLGERSAGEGARLLLGKPSPCVGRERELRALGEVLDECITESVARAVLVKAPAGAGKSRFLHELLTAASHREEAPVIWLGRGDLLSAGSAFALVASALRHAAGLREGEALALRRQKLSERVAQHVPDKDRLRVAAFLGDLTGTPFLDDDLPMLRAAGRDPVILGEQLRRAFEDFLGAECAARPVLLALEDVHWGDQPSFKLIDAALSKLRNLPLLVVAVGRPEVDELFPRLWAERGVQEIRLAELTRRASERLVRNALGDAAPKETVARIVERAAGNAFYLEELIRAVAEGRGDDLPETVLAMVQARLDALGPDDRRLLRAASVFGETFWSAGACALLGGTEQQEPTRARIEALIGREVFVRHDEGRFPGEEELGFRHALLRDGAYATLTDHDRRVGHLLAGSWLEERGEGDPLVLAEHFERGGEPPRAVVHYFHAAEKAVSGGDFSVITRAERGLACAAEGPLRSSLVLLLGRARWMIGDIAGAEVMQQEFVRTTPPGHPGYPFLLTGKLITSLHRGDTQGVLAAVAAARALEQGTENAPLLAELHWAMSGRVPHLCDEGDRARALRVVELLSPHDHLALGYLAATKGNLAASFDGDLERGAALNLEAAAYLETAASLVNAARMRSLAGTFLGLLGARERAEQEHGRAVAQTGGQGMQGALVRIARAFAELGQGAVAEARAEGERLVSDAVLARDPGREGRARQLFAAALLRSGELAAAEREAEASLALPWLFSFQRAETLATLGAIRLAQGRPAEALTAASEAMGSEEPPRVRLFHEPSVRLVHVDALDAAGDAEASRRALATARARLLEAAAKIGDPALRESFLEGAADNARTLRLAEERLGPA